MRMRRSPSLRIGFALAAEPPWTNQDTYQCRGASWSNELLLGADGSPPLQRKLFIFDGRVRVVQTVCADEAGPHHRSYHDREWRPLDWYLKTPNQPELCPKPKRYKEMVALAECLGRDFDHLRVDMYDADDSMWVGELTLYSWSGLASFTPDEADKLV